jgi:ABC-type Fe3+-hydroxamate transport system substrate-binding protein
MPVFTDQTGREVFIADTPTRIVSIVPSQTELLAHLGLNDEVVGITKFCIHPPEWFNNKTRIGGTKQLHIDRIKLLQPDLIIANKEENIKEQVEELMQDFPVWVSDVNNLQDALQMIEQIGTIIGKDKQANQLVLSIEESFSQLKTTNQKLRTAYLIWKKPYMTVGGDTFIHAMMQAAGFENIFAHTTRYPEVTVDQLKASNIELLLLSSEPYPFKQQHIDELQQHLPTATILLSDGEMFSWYGSRLLKAPEYFKQLQEEIKMNR